MPPSKDPKQRAKQIAQLRKGSAPLANVKQPTITIAAAQAFVKMQLAGIPDLQALHMLYPDYMRAVGTHKRRAEIVRWQKNPHVEKATADAQGAMWQEMEPDDRLKAAYDKHCAQCAFLLYSTDYASADGDMLRKIQDARATLVARLRDDGEDDSDSPINRLFARLLRGEVEKELDQPVFQGETAPVELFIPDGRPKS